jgi:hypothetical protein
VNPDRARRRLAIFMLVVFLLAAGFMASVMIAVFLRRE